MTGSGVIELIFQGGVLMFPIMLTSVIALAIALERFITLRRTTLDTREFMDTLRTVLRQRRVQEAIEICDENPSPIARIVKAGLLKHDREKEDIREAVEDAGRLEVPRLERYMAGLATCASVAPMLGLLGTVQGMIKAFGSRRRHRQRPYHDGGRPDGRHSNLGGLQLLRQPRRQCRPRDGGQFLRTRRVADQEPRRVQHVIGIYEVSDRP